MVEPISMAAIASFALNVGKSVAGNLFGMQAAKSEARQAIQTAGFQAGGAIRSNALSAQLDVEDAYFSADRAILSAGFAGGRAVRANLGAAEQVSLNIEQLLRSTAIEENRLRDQGDRTIASQAAYFGANGIDISEGAPVMLAAMSAGQLETDAQMLRANGFAAAAGLGAQRVAYIQRAEDARDEALFRIEDATTAADRIGGRATSLQKMRDDETLSALGMNLQRALQRSSAAKASAVLKIGTDTLSAAVNSFGGSMFNSAPASAASATSVPVSSFRMGFASPGQRA